MTRATTGSRADTAPGATDALVARFRAVRTWSRPGERAPHKPLLALLALAEHQRGHRGPLKFAEIQERLVALLREFAPSRAVVHPEYPFVRLRNDGIWDVNLRGVAEYRSGDVSAARLVAVGATGGFTPDVVAALDADPALAEQIVHALLEKTFPPSVHQDVLEAVGLVLTPTRVDREALRRDAAFRTGVLAAYRRRCGVCSFSVRLGDALVGVEAAHIKWHAYEGPSVVPNGLALCSLHHKLFDRGVFTLSDDLRVMVSTDVNGETGTAGPLLRDLRDRPLDFPTDPTLAPDRTFIAWHRREVFRAA